MKQTNVNRKITFKDVYSTVTSKQALEGTLKKQFGFKKVWPTDTENYWLECLIKVRHFNVSVAIKNLEEVTVDIIPKQKFQFNAESVQVAACKFSYQRVKEIINYYQRLK